jgi:hypothetical protein
MILRLSHGFAECKQSAFDMMAGECSSERNSAASLVRKARRSVGIDQAVRAGTSAFVALDS